MFNNPYISNEALYIIFFATTIFSTTATLMRLYRYVYSYFTTGDTGIQYESRSSIALTIFIVIYTIVFFVLTIIARTKM